MSIMNWLVTNAPSNVIKSLLIGDPLPVPKDVGEDGLFREDEGDDFLARGVVSRELVEEPLHRLSLLVQLGEHVLGAHPEEGVVASEGRGVELHIRAPEVRPPRLSGMGAEEGREDLSFLSALDVR